MYYSKIFLLYSLIGFIYESTLYKITKMNKHSGIFYGPITAVYGVGIVSIELLNNYIFKKIKINKILKIILEFIILTITLTIIEYLGGNILNILFSIDMWDYSKYPFNYGKYICLYTSLTWGILGLIYLYIFKHLTDKIIRQITNKETYAFIIFFLLDTFLVLVTKI